MFMGFSNDERFRFFWTNEFPLVDGYLNRRWLKYMQTMDHWNENSDKMELRTEFNAINGVEWSAVITGISTIV